ncbi:helix-turn-helix domain-containing protein [Streptomyces sp. adm13(2018)]|uniref:helix-turn-helix domain-containing protein n=1 Tax=Streptomyces sp. adm13(2018) TaxID=2479007 RepID=UPI0011CDC83A|nr:helix-turn-helix domain-containing protein [Streptomyces sp. adm13(2018)]TXS07049.1 helix-turn-helix domain-containing protein [Streptomyces sp. adm13(2018)]
MSTRDAITALIRDGHTDASIALRLGCDRSTVSKTRRGLAKPDACRVVEYRPDRMPTSPAQQAANRARLLEALRAA